jgi:polyhydroxyalkanoate synthesis regulator phasin
MPKAQERSITLPAKCASYMIDLKTNWPMAYGIKIEKSPRGDIKVYGLESSLKKLVRDLVEEGEITSDEMLKVLDTMDPPASLDNTRSETPLKKSRPAEKFTMRVGKHYAFAFEDEIEDQEANYGIKIVKGPRGSFLVTGEESALESFADDITIGDQSSSQKMLDTLKPVISESNRHMQINTSQLRLIIKEELTRKTLNEVTKAEGEILDVRRLAYDLKDIAAKKKKVIQICQRFLTGDEEKDHLIKYTILHLQDIEGLQTMIKGLEVVMKQMPDL